MPHGPALTVLKTSNRIDGSAVHVVVPDAVSIAEAQSFASGRYAIPVLVLPKPMPAGDCSRRVGARSRRVDLVF